MTAELINSPRPRVDDTSIQLAFPVFEDEVAQKGKVSARHVNVVRDLADYSPSKVAIPVSATIVTPSPHSDPRRVAIRRIQRLAAVDGSWGRSPDSDPVSDADHRTSMSDARIALCVARGTALDDIDPTTGYDVSRRAYERSRSEWRRYIEQQGWDAHTAGQYANVRARWEARRPEWAVGDDWLAGLTELDEARKALEEARDRIRSAIEGTP